MTPRGQGILKTSTYRHFSLSLERDALRREKKIVPRWRKFISPCRENWKEKECAQRMHNSWWEDRRDWGWDESHDGDDREKWNKKECAEPGTLPASRDSSSSSAATEMSHKPASHAEDTGAVASSSCEENSGSASAAAMLAPYPS